MKRKKISGNDQAEVIFRSNRECVICSNHKRGDHIHHIDGNKTNNKFENLAFLCFDCHSDATMTGGLKKKLTPKTIMKFRDHKYQVVAIERENALKRFNSPIDGLTTEDLLTTTKSAIIIIEIEKIKEEYFSAEWTERPSIILKLNRFLDHTNFRVAVDIFNFFSIVADQTRFGMTTDVAVSIFTLTINFFPYSNKKEDDGKIFELGNECVNIAFSLIYDSIIHLKNYNIAMYGLTMLKYVHKKGKQHKIKQLGDRVLETYKEIERMLQRVGRNDLEIALRLVREFKSDLNGKNLSFPLLSDDLMKVIIQTAK
ncbi:MAG: HNH endonuclease [Cyclobacteriaceae bacterium]|nr:HNH endonuclease [Cyclobacteriaceae bacterium]